MAANSHRECWAQAVEKALSRQALLNDALHSRVELARPGDLFASHDSSQVPLNWALLQVHPDHPALFFAVPGDDFPLIGPTDVPVPETSVCAPLTLRCGHGLWIRAVDFERTRRVGFLDAEVIVVARRMLAALARGQCSASPAGLEVEANPEYQEWIDQVEQVRALYAVWLEETAVLRLSDFRSDPPRAHSSRLDDVMAATPGGLLGELAALVSRVLSDEPIFHPAPIPGPGELHLRASQGGVGAVWIGSEGKPPLLRAESSDGALLKARWHPVNATTRETVAPFPWSGDRVVLRIGPGKGKRITVQR